jgi:hypothetical protein
MEKLYPMVRRVRRPLLPVEEAVTREVAKDAKKKPVEPEQPVPTETPDDAGSDT